MADRGRDRIYGRDAGAPGRGAADRQCGDAASESAGLREDQLSRAVSFYPVYREDAEIPGGFRRGAAVGRGRRIRADHEYPSQQRTGIPGGICRGHGEKLQPAGEPGQAGLPQPVRNRAGLCGPGTPYAQGHAGQTDDTQAEPAGQSGRRTADPLCGHDPREREADPDRHGRRKTPAGGTVAGREAELSGTNRRGQLSGLDPACAEGRGKRAGEKTGFPEGTSGRRSEDPGAGRSEQGRDGAPRALPVRGSETGRGGGPEALLEISVGGRENLAAEIQRDRTEKTPDGRRVRRRRRDVPGIGCDPADSAVYRKTGREDRSRPGNGVPCGHGMYGFRKRHGDRRTGGTDPGGTGRKRQTGTAGYRRGECPGSSEVYPKPAGETDAGRRPPGRSLPGAAVCHRTARRPGGRLRPGRTGTDPGNHRRVLLRRR